MRSRSKGGTKDSTNPKGLEHALALLRQCLQSLTEAGAPWDALSVMSIQVSGATEEAVLSPYLSLTVSKFGHSLIKCVGEQPGISLPSQTRSSPSKPSTTTRKKRRGSS